MKRFLAKLFFCLVFVTDALAFLTFNQEIDISENAITDTEGARGINFKPDGLVMYVTRRTNEGGSSDGL